MSGSSYAVDRWAVRVTQDPDYRRRHASDVVITLACGDTGPILPGERYEDWVLEDPAGQDVAAVRPIRDEIERRVIHLLNDELGVPVDGATEGSLG